MLRSIKCSFHIPEKKLKYYLANDHFLNQTTLPTGDYMKAFLICLVSIVIFTHAAHTQSANDSLRHEIIKNTQRFSTDTSTVTVMSRLEKISLRVDTVIQNLGQKFNVAAIEKSLDDIEKKLEFSGKYINTTDEHFSFRLLKVHSVFLLQLKKKLDAHSAHLQRYNKEIAKIEKNISGFIADSSYRMMPSDEAARNVFLTQYNQILERWLKADSINKERELLITRIQSRLTKDYIVLSGLSENVIVRMERFNQNILKASDKPLLNTRKNDYSKSIYQVIPDSAETSSAIMLYYLTTNRVPLTATILVCFLFIIWLIFIRREYTKHIVSYVRSSNIRLKYLSNHPIFGSLLLGISFSVFFFPHPPIIFLELLWTILGLVLTILFFKDKSVSSRVRFTWTAFFIIFRVVAVLNLFLYATFEERWLLLLINIICLALDVLIIETNRKKHIFHLKRTAWVIYISATLHIISIICNFTGLFNLAKTLTVTATFAVFTAATLRAFVDTGREALTFQLAMLKRRITVIHEKNLTKIYNFFSNLLDVFAITAWIIIFLINLNVWEYLKDQTFYFLNYPILVGSISFTTGSILLFVIIILASALLSNLISVITDISSSQNSKYNFLSNIKLVVKLFVVTVGILLAIAATGIPIDKIAIVLGALSVGIGFGLQNLVGNLVSGVMITLERPIRIGDLVEVGSHKGIIKEIGIRSSIIYTSNGCDVIIPNSDVLSQHVVNWTLSNPQTRIELELYIEDSDNLNQAKTLLTNILNEDPLLIKEPPPLVVVNSLINATIGFNCFCWCADHSQVTMVKSEILEKIYDEFKKHSIIISDNKVVTLKSRS